jgi:hypothetical protein
MGGLDARLRRLESRLLPSPEQQSPIEVRILLRHIERERAVEEGLEPPNYTEDELEHLYQEDLLGAAGKGTIAAYRGAAGWQREESQNTLDAWQSQAKQRVELVKELGEEWRDVYNKDLVDEEAQEEGLSIFDLLENEQNERMEECPKK